MSNQQDEQSLQEPNATLHPISSATTTTTLLSAGKSPISTPDRLIISKKRSPSPSSLQEKLQSKRTVLFPSSTTQQLQRSSSSPTPQVEPLAAPLLYRTASAPPSSLQEKLRSKRTLLLPVSSTPPQLQRPSPTPPQVCNVNNNEPVAASLAPGPPVLHRTESAPPSGYKFLASRDNAATATRTLPTSLVTDQESNAKNHLNFATVTTLLSAVKSPVSTPDRLISKKTSPSSLQEKLRSKRTILFPSSAIPQLQHSSSSPTPQLSFKNNEPVEKPTVSLPPPLHRTTSASYDTAATSTRALPAPVSDQETQYAKKLRVVKEKLQEMNEWCSKFLSETEEAAEESAVTACAINKADEPQNAAVESVRVDEIPGGGGLVIQFDCPCGKEFEVLRIGEDWWRRLEEFPVQEFEIRRI